MATPLEIAAGATVELVLAAVAIGVLYRVWGSLFAVPKRFKVLTFQRGVILKGEEVEKVVGPGSYWITPKRTLVLCDMRPKPFQLAGLELVSADGMGMRLSFGVEYQITDAASFLTRSSDTYAAFYIDLRQAIRIAVREQSSRNLMNETETLTARIREMIADRSEHLGVGLFKLDVWEMVMLGMQREPSGLDFDSQPIQ
jgi:regulator of protease activity HflC (stomatin/prohibitin superfamily)